MSDCALAIAGAVHEVFDDLGVHTPKHYWCLFHVFKAFKDQAKTHVPHLVDEALFDFRDIAYSTSSPIPKMVTFLEKWNNIHPNFANYFRDSGTNTYYIGPFFAK
jgi:hypothetical protein